MNLFTFLHNKTLLTETVLLTPASIDTLSAKLREFSSSIGLAHDMQIKLSLQVETLLINWQEFYTTETQVELRLYRLWNRYYVSLSLAGEKHNPLLDSTLYGLPLEYAEYLEDIQSVNDIRPQYNYKAGTNIVKIALPRKELSSITKIFIAMGAAIATYGLCLYLPPDTVNIISKDVVSPLMGLLLNIIKMLSNILIFTAMVTGICEIGDMRIFTKYGRSMLVHIQLGNYSAVLLGLCVSVFFAGVSISGLSLDFATLTPLLKIFISIFPTNIVKPFADNNSIQILTMGFILGCFFLTVQDKVRNIYNNIVELSFTVVHLLTIACKLIPYIVYLSVTKLLLSNSLSKAGLVVEIAGIYIACLSFYVLCSLARVAWQTHVSFSGLLKNFFGAVLTGLTSASSMAVMPLVQEVCAKKYKLHETFLNFSLPLSIIMSKPLNGMYIIIITLLTVKGYGMNVTFSQLVSGFVLVAFMSSAIPPVPGGSCVVLTIAFTHFNLPQEALALPLAVDFFFDMLRTGFQAYIWGGNLVLMDKKLHASK